MTNLPPEAQTALDSLLQAGQQAAGALIVKATSGLNLQQGSLVGLAQLTLSQLVGAPKTPDTAQKAQTAVGQLSSAATAMGDTQTAGYLSQQLQAFKATLQANGVAGGPPWLTIIGLGAGAVAVYLLWQHYSGKKKVFDAMSYPDPKPIGPRLKMMGASLGSFRKFGDPEKYEFEPELRLEGYRKRKVCKGVRR